MTAIQYQKDDEGIVTLTMDLPGQAANIMNQAFREGLAETVVRLEAERAEIRGVILTSAKSTFFAGGDLNGLLAVQPSDAAASTARGLAVKDYMRRMERLGKPVVAAINGTALGGGFELCLACHARIAIDNDKTQLGLPETGLGLMPGGGGIVRMTRMMGLEAAMPLILEGQTFTPRKALALKLVDGLAKDRDDLIGQARAWIFSHPEAKQPWDVKGFRMPGATSTAAASMTWLRTMPVKLHNQHRGLVPGPQAALSAAVEGAMLDFEAASRIESRYLVHCATHPVAKNLIRTFFFQMNEIKSGKSRPEGVPKAKFTKIGVLGAGLMGAGIAQVAAQRGLTAVLKDVTLATATRGKVRIADTLAKRVAKEQLTAEAREQTLERIQVTAHAADLSGCELIVEAVLENRETKTTVAREAEPYLAASGVFASNTSTLPITGLAEASTRPQNFIGLHFFSPVDRMPLVEIVRGAQTSDETLARAYDFVQQLGKTPIVVNDSRGFFTSRVFGAYTKEGLAMLAEGVPAAMVENIAWNVGMPVGPLAVMDETSLALAWAVWEQTLADLTAEGKPHVDHPGWSVIGTMVNDLKRPGRAGGGGFYDYPADGPKQLWSGLAKAFPSNGSLPSVEDVGDRLLYSQAIEALRAMEEGVVNAARDANVGSLLGIGFPRWTGGVLQFVNMVGVRRFAERAQELADRYGVRFAPPKLLLEHAEREEIFV